MLKSYQINNDHNYWSYFLSNTTLTQKKFKLVQIDNINHLELLSIYGICEFQLAQHVKSIIVE